MHHEELPVRGTSAAAIVLGGSVLCLAMIAAGGRAPASGLFWMTLGVPAVLVAVSALVIRKRKPCLFQRRWGRDPIERGYEMLLLGLAAILAAATCFVSSLDYFQLHIGYLGSWCAPAGLAITSVGVMMYQQALLAYAPHDRSRYGEKPDAEAAQGPYAQVRHPLSGWFLVSLLGVPLMLSSWVGLIGWALTALVTVVYVAKEDRWRFMNYEWYYEYTAQARYKLIPMIW